MLGALSAWSAWGQTAQTSEPKPEQAQEQIKQLETKIEELDQKKIRRADRTKELEQEAATAKAQDAPVVQAGRDGFWFKSANGDFQLKAGGYLHSDGRFYPSDTSNQATNTFVLRRVRPLLQGTLYKFIDFRLMPDFGEGKAVLQDAYLELRYFPKASLRAGKFKTPFGLERLQSATDLVFVERGLPTNLVPSRDLGIQLSGDLAKNRLNYAIGVFNGTPDGGSVDGACHDSKDYVARLFATPFQSFPAGHPLRGLGVGLAASRGKQHGALPVFKTAGQSIFFSYAANASASGFRTRLSPQVYYYYGAVGLIAEFVRSEQKVEGGGDSDSVINKSRRSCCLLRSHLLRPPPRGGAPGGGGGGGAFLWVFVGRGLVWSFRCLFLSGGRGGLGGGGGGWGLVVN